MLVLSRKIGDRIVIGDEVVVQVLASDGHRVRIGIEAPVSVPIRREELLSEPSLSTRCRTTSAKPALLQPVVPKSR